MYTSSIRALKYINQIPRHLKRETDSILLIDYGTWMPYFIYFFFNSKVLFLFFLLYNIVLVLPYSNMHPPQVYTCSPSWIPLPPPSPYHPSGSSQCTSPKLLVSCIKPGLVIHFLYDIIHVLMPFSQIIPPSLSHRVQKTGEDVEKREPSYTVGGNAN